MLNTDIQYLRKIYASCEHSPLAKIIEAQTCIRTNLRLMEPLDEQIRIVIDSYQRRFGITVDVPVRDLDYQKRSRLIAALERALQRNMALFDYELQEFDISRRQRVWMALKRRVSRLAARRGRVV